MCKQLGAEKMRYRDPYRVFPKTLPSGRTIYYYTAYDHLGRRKQFSTGQIKRSDAKRYCLKLFQTGSLIQIRDKRFSEYTQDWYVYDKCPYIESRLIRGYSYSRSIANNKRSHLENRILPYFGKYFMKDITTAHIEDWLLIQKRTGVSNLTVNHYLSTLRVIFNEAFRKSDIPANPIAAVKPLSEDTRRKDTLTRQEVSKLFEEAARAKIWGNELHYLFNLTASQTGMRIGEIQALRIENLHDDHIVVKHSWDRRYGLKGTKNGKERIVPINDSLSKVLRGFYRIQGASEPYIFSVSAGHQPIDHKAIYKWFYRALERIGIDKKSREERNVTFHSWRYYVNTQLSARGVPESMIQAIIGHSDGKMTKHYTNYNMEDLKRILTL